MAEAVTEGAREVEGIEVCLYRVADAKAEDLADAEAIILRAPTQNAKVPPEMSEFLKAMEQVHLTGKTWAVFGSYGWSWEAVSLIRSALVAQGVRVPGVGVRAKRTPDQEALGNCWELGQAVAKRLTAGTE